MAKLTSILVNFPQFEGLTGTYCNNMSPDHFLTKMDKIAKMYYDESFFKGKIEEASYDANNVIKDYDSLGNEVNCDFDIQKENCQRAKSLSSKAQRQSRIKLKDSIKLKQNRKHQVLFQTETKKYNDNTQCENQILGIFNKISPSITTTSSSKSEESIQPRNNYMQVLNRLTIAHFR